MTARFSTAPSHAAVHSIETPTTSGRWEPEVAVLTAGRDRPYAIGLASALAAEGIRIDYVGSDNVFDPKVCSHPMVRFLKLRDQEEGAGAARKVVRVLTYYARLIGYACRSRAPVFHILWNNKFEWFDRTVLMALYRMLGKRICLTAHNVNAGVRDGNDSWLNRATLKVQYELCHRIFVHTRVMAAELVRDFNVAADKPCLIPFGINNTLPSTQLDRPAARAKLGLTSADRVILFFGNIVPYKGLEYLVEAFEKVASEDSRYRLLIAGRPKPGTEYSEGIVRRIQQSRQRDRILFRPEFVPDEAVEGLCKAADVLVLPYTHIFQSGVLFVGYSFGLPVIATDVGSLKEDIVEGRTGFICKPRDAESLATALRQYFASELYAHLATRGSDIQAYANETFSWTKVGAITRAVYRELQGRDAPSSPLATSQNSHNVM